MELIWILIMDRFLGWFQVGCGCLFLIRAFLILHLKKRWGCLFVLAAAVHSDHEARASLSGGRSVGWSSRSEQTHRGVRQEEADHKGIFPEFTDCAVGRSQIVLSFCSVWVWPLMKHCCVSVSSRACGHPAVRRQLWGGRQQVWQ